MRCDPVGSVWRRPDLQVYKPASFDYEDGSVNARVLVDGFVTAGVEVVAITTVTSSMWHSSARCKREMQVLRTIALRCCRA